MHTATLRDQDLVKDRGVLEEYKGTSVNDDWLHSSSIKPSASIYKLVITQTSSINLWHCNHKLIPASHCPNYSCTYPNLLGMDGVQTTEMFWKSKPKMIGCAPRHASKPNYELKYVFIAL